MTPRTTHIRLPPMPVLSYLLDLADHLSRVVVMIDFRGILTLGIGGALVESIPQGGITSDKDRNMRQERTYLM